MFTLPCSINGAFPQSASGARTPPYFNNKSKILRGREVGGFVSLLTTTGPLPAVPQPCLAIQYPIKHNITCPKVINRKKRKTNQPPLFIFR